MKKLILFLSVLSVMGCKDTFYSTKILKFKTEVGSVDCIRSHEDQRYKWRRFLGEITLVISNIHEGTPCMLGDGRTITINDDYVQFVR